jgi:hypothetical protein
MFEEQNAIIRRERMVAMGGGLVVVAIIAGSLPAGGMIATLIVFP